MSRLAESLAALLNDLFEKHSSGNQVRSIQHRPRPQIEPFMLLVDGERTPIQIILEVACVMWDDIVGSSTQRKEPVSPPFWEPEYVDRRKRINAMGANFSFFLEYAVLVSGSCVVFATSDGFPGLAPSSLTLGGSIVSVKNCRFPLILHGEGDLYSFRGLPYVHGTMDGLLLEPWKDKSIQETEWVMK